MAEPVVAALPRPGNVVFDVDGCLTIGGQAVPGAAAAIAAVGNAGARAIIATNNSTRPADDLADRLGTILGLPLDPSMIVTSAHAAVAILTGDDAPILVIGEAGIHAALAGRGLTTTIDPDVARTVLVGLDRSFDYAAMRRASHAVAMGARLVATNDDRTFPSAGPDVPGAGAILASIEAASGVRAIVCGKPHPPMIRALAPLLSPGSTWMVGDRLETDIAFARAAGYHGILVLTGVTGPDTDRRPHLPDRELASVAELPDLLERSAQ